MSDISDTSHPQRDDTDKSPGSGSKQNHSTESQTVTGPDDAALAYKPGDSVLIKIQGYPWWPAVVRIRSIALLTPPKVVTPDHFPQQALAARPKTQPRKDGTFAAVYPVQFLGSPEYYWSRATDMKSFSKKEAELWLNSGKKAQSKGLKAAYEQALTSPTLETLLEAKIRLEEQTEQTTTETTEIALDDEFEDDDVELDDEGKPIKKKKKALKKTSGRTPKSGTTQTPSKRRKSDSQEGNSVGKKSKTSKSITVSSPYERPISPELSPEEVRKRAWDNKVKTVMYLRHKLQKTLLGKDEPKGPELDEVPNHLRKLDDVEVDVDIIRETKIGKVLLRINKLEQIPKDSELGLKLHVESLLKKWQGVMAEAAKKPVDSASEGLITETNGQTEVNGHADQVEKAVDIKLADEQCDKSVG